MKAKIFFITFIFFTIGTSVFFSQSKIDSIVIDKRKSYQEKMHSLQLARIDIVVNSLGLTGDKEQQFRSLYKNYEAKQAEIIRNFKSSYPKNDDSEEATKERIYKSFDVAQELLNTRRSYADKFLNIISPKQLEQVFEVEKRTGRQIFNKKHK